MLIKRWSLLATKLAIQATLKVHTYSTRNYLEEPAVSCSMKPKIMIDLQHWDTMHATEAASINCYKIFMFSGSKYFFSLIPRPRPAFGHSQFFVRVRGEPGNEANISTQLFCLVLFCSTLTQTVFTYKIGSGKCIGHLWLKHSTTERGLMRTNDVDINCNIESHDTSLAFHVYAYFG